MNRDGSRAKFSSAQMADGKLLLRTLGRSHALRLFPLRERHDVPRAFLAAVRATSLHLNSKLDK